MKGYFEAIKDTFREHYMDVYHWSSGYRTMRSKIEEYLGTQEAQDFEKYHKTIEETIKEYSVEKSIRQHFDPDLIESQYREYMAEKLTKAYRYPDAKELEGVDKNKLVEHYTEKFKNEEAVTLPEEVVLAIGRGVTDLLDAIFTNLHRKILELRGTE